MDKDLVLRYIGELSLNNYSLLRELQSKDEEIARLRAMLEKLSGSERIGNIN